MTDESVTYAPVAFRDDKGRFLPGTPLTANRKLLEATLRRVVVQDHSGKLRKACEQLLTDAAESDNWQHRLAAFSLIADRLDGKAVARIETSDGSTRGLDFNELVSIILRARSTDATDATAIAHATDSVDSTVPSP